MTLYAVTIFLSAFLLFQVQPLIAKMILPWFGGSAAVWSASLLFFQLLLLAGYAYAHLSIRYLKARPQMIVHAALLAVSCALLPILPSPGWRPTVAGDPTFRILGVLGATIGLPYFLLSSTSPLLQAWYVRRSGSGMPYRLFALSNFGSMLALVSFPFLVEPQLASRSQAYGWSGGYVAFALLCAFTAWASRESQAEPALVAALVDSSNAADSSADPTAGLSSDLGASDPTDDNLANDDSAAAAAPAADQAPGFFHLAFWVLLATCASVLLISVTNHMSENVAPIPLLWVLPLAVYLLTFILAFESDRLYQRWLFMPLLAVALGGMVYMIHASEGNLTIKWAIPGFAAGLFVCCMVCHGELARRRPAPRHLTLFYLMVSLGGALGGIFVALIAPRVFNSYVELPLGLVACGLLALAALWNVANGWMIWALRIFAAVCVSLLAGYAVRQEREFTKGLTLQTRNFYGPLQVRDDPPSQDYAVRTLLHGTIDHGAQLKDPALRYVTTSYYGKESGVGRAMMALQSKGAVRVGVIGLGAGVLSNYGRQGDYFRIYEINPLVENIAQTLFTFYPHSGADKKIIMGDARLTMEAQEPQNFDLIAVDAFSSDAIPVHLLTREATLLYQRQLRPGGILALHISNRYLNLEPVCQGDAQAIGAEAMVIDDEGESAPYYSSSTWVLVSTNKEFFKDPEFAGSNIHPAKMPAKFRPWTDDYSNLFQILALDK